MSNQLSRRNLLKGIGIGTAGLALGANFSHLTPALAQAPTFPPASAFYRFMLGKMELTVIQDGLGTFESGTFAVNAPAGAADKVLADNNLPQKTVPVTVNVLLVKSGDQLLLIDSGALGFALAPNAPPFGGRLFATLDLLGVKRDAITGIVLSHYHPDHIAGLGDDKGALFPKATIYFPEPEQKFLDTAPSGTPLDAFIQLAKARLSGYKDRVKTFKSEGVVIPGVTAMPAPGHTPGQSLLALESDGAQFMYLADTLGNAPISFAHPEWHFGFDQDPELAVKTRKSVLSMVSSKTVPVFGAHYTFPGIGYVDTDGDGYRFIPSV